MIPQDYGIVVGTNCNGRYLYFIDKDHPLSHQCGCVYVHRHNMSLKLGRWITSEESVHHVNGDPLDNSFDNLVVLSNVEHGKFIIRPCQK